MAYELTVVNDLRTVPPNTKELNTVSYGYAEKADLSKSYWIPKRICGLVMYLSETIKQQ